LSLCELFGIIFPADSLYGEVHGVLDPIHDTSVHAIIVDNRSNRARDNTLFHRLIKVMSGWERKLQIRYSG
jgi:hypothetical protein